MNDLTLCEVDNLIMMIDFLQRHHWEHEYVRTARVKLAKRRQEMLTEKQPLFEEAAIKL